MAVAFTMDLDLFAINHENSQVYDYGARRMLHEATFHFLANAHYNTKVEVTISSEEVGHLYTGQDQITVVHAGPQAREQLKTAVVWPERAIARFSTRGASRNEVLSDMLENMIFMRLRYTANLDMVPGWGHDYMDWVNLILNQFYTSHGSIDPTRLKMHSRLLYAGLKGQASSFFNDDVTASTRIAMDAPDCIRVINKWPNSSLDLY